MTKYVCPYCGSDELLQDAYFVINTEETRTFDDIRCGDCGENGITPVKYVPPIRKPKPVEHFIQTTHEQLEDFKNDPTGYLCTTREWLERDIWGEASTYQGSIIYTPGRWMLRIKPHL